MTSQPRGQRTLLAVIGLSLVLVIATGLVAAAPLAAPHHSRGSASGPGWAREGPTYPLLFNESGLPNGTYWSVQVYGAAATLGWYDNSSSNATVGFQLPNGTYNFSISPADNGSQVFLPTPPSGDLVVNGTGATVVVDFVPLAEYNLTFAETGLPDGTFWSVDLGGNGSGNATPAPDCYGVTYENGSTNTTVNFTLPDGTYSFAIPNASNNTTLFVPTPSAGNVSVNGSNVTVDVSFAAVPLVPVTFVETGLPGGTNWTVYLFNDTAGWYFNDSANASLGFLVPDGVYGFAVGNVAGNGSLYLPTPATGNVTVNGSSVTVDVAYAAITLYNLSFEETGLPNGTWWYVDLFNGSTGGSFNGSTNNTVSFDVANGTYGFAVGTWAFDPYAAAPAPACFNGSDNGTLYVPSPGSGNVTVNGSNVTVNVTFAPLAIYNLTFEETGLPNGTFWSVALAGDSSNGGWGNGSGGDLAPVWYGWQWNGSANTTVNFTVYPGTYGFSVGNVSGNGTLFVPSPANGTVTVNGTNVTVDIAFSTVLLYNVTFAETGLPNGTWWYVNLDANASGPLFNGSTGPSVGFELPNGTYTFSVGAGSSGPFFGPACYNVTGNGTGGPYVPTPANGTVVVDGSNVTVNISFAPLALYNVTFAETGLPNGTYWYVDLASGWWDSTFNASFGSTVGFEVPNGTYTFSVGSGFAHDPPGAAPGWWNGSGSGSYVPTPQTGTVSVFGSNVTVSIDFAPLVYYAVTFNETGLPNGTAWSVDLGGSSSGGWGDHGAGPLCGPSPNGSGGPVVNGTTITFELPNGVYNFTVANVTTNNTTYVPTPSSGSVTVNGSNVSVSVSFVAGGDPPSGGHASDSQAAHIGAGPGTMLGNPMTWMLALLGAIAAVLGALLVLGHRRRGGPGSNGRSS